MTAKESFQRFSRLRSWLWVLYGVLPSLVGVLAFMESRAAPRSTGVVIVLGYLGLVVALQFRLAFWSCPRCGKAFWGGWRAPAGERFFTVANRKCKQCGLPWYEQ